MIYNMKKISRSFLLITIVVATIISCSPAMLNNQNRTYYEEYINNHPRSSKVNEAKSQIEELDWKQAESICTIPAYESYLKSYPVSAHSDLANKRISFLNDIANAKSSNSLTEWQTIINKNKIDYDFINNPDDDNVNISNRFKAGLNKYLKGLNYKIDVNITKPLLTPKEMPVRDLINTKNEIEMQFRNAILSRGYNISETDPDVIMNIGYEEYIGSRTESIEYKTTGSVYGTPYLKTTSETRYLNDVPCSNVRINIKYKNSDFFNQELSSLKPVSDKPNVKNSNYKFDYQGKDLGDYVENAVFLFWISEPINQP
jgi:hypothetical protein